LFALLLFYFCSQILLISIRFAGEEGLENWRIIKEDQIEEAESPRKKQENIGIRTKKEKPFTKASHKEITDDEWEEMNEVFS
jgi:hypothetical protein